MKREEIEKRIEEVLSPIFMGDGLRVKELTDLFIELSNEAKDAPPLETKLVVDLTDEEAEEVANILCLKRDEMKSPLANGFNRKEYAKKLMTFEVDTFMGRSYNFLKAVDYLRSKGYSY